MEGKNEEGRNRGGLGIGASLVFGGEEKKKKTRKIKWRKRTRKKDKKKKKKKEKVLSRKGAELIGS
jgi:5'-3' exonuclease